MDPKDARLIDQIQSIRASNNARWMDLVRLALEVAPIRAREIFREIASHDEQILNLSRSLAHVQILFPLKDGSPQQQQLDSVDPAKT